MLSGCIKGTASATNEMKHSGFSYNYHGGFLVQIVSMVARNQIHPLNINESVITPLVGLYLIYLWPLGSVTVNQIQPT